MKIKEIITKVKGKDIKINRIIFVGCGASYSDLYPAEYFLKENSSSLQISSYTANEFNYATPKAVGTDTIVIAASLGGATPETVQAATKAKELGAQVITLTRKKESPLAQVNPQYLIVHGFGKDYAAKLEKMTIALQLAVEILKQFEEYSDYELMLNGFAEIYDLIRQAVTTVRPQAAEFARQYKEAKIVYFMSSGATAQVAYATSICLFMEMQWMNSASFHTGEFFHGPFEIVDKDVPFVLFMNEGKTRPIDSRALTFLHRFDAKITLLDAKDFGLSSVIPAEVIDYFNPMLLTAVMRIYAEEIANLRNHPLTKRRYMWKLDY
jgi:fructoselysine-6-P-deglycase FrlB-like protein